MTRSSVGYRLHVATIERHNGNTDDFGQPTYTVDADWEEVVSEWRCELRGVKGGETVRGRQVSANAAYMLTGEHSAVKDVLQSDRIKINGLTLGILDVTDLYGDARDMVIDAKAE